MTLNGTGFSAGAVVHWDGAVLATTFISSTQLRATVPANLITAPGTVSVTASVGGVTSSSTTFTIRAGPVIGSISPSAVTAGGEGFTLTVNGTGFDSGSTVRWDGAPLSTTFISSTQLRAVVGAARIARPGQARLVVVNADGAVSNSIFLLLNQVSIPTVQLTGLVAAPIPTQPIAVGIDLAAPAPARLDGTLAIDFYPNAEGVGEDYRDPALQFAGGGTTLDFTIAMDQKTATLPLDGAIQQGTVAGDITVRVA